MKNQKRKDVKLERILNAAKEEFSIEPYHKVSVFKIAEKAGISRASFYCYFKSKDDIYEYILNEIREELFKNCIGSKKPEYFDFIEDFFNYLLSFKNSRNQKLFLMILDNIRPETINFIAEGRKFPSILNIVDFSRFKDTTVETLKVLIKSNIACVALMAVHYLKGLATEEKVRETFKNCINLLKFGAYKN